MKGDEDKMLKKSGLTKRQKDIIEMLAKFTFDNPITVQAISEKLDLSSRTVLREMPQIDAWFEKNDFHLVKKPRVGLYVDEDEDTRKFLLELVQMDKNKISFTKEERQEGILFEILLVNEPLKYYYFTSLFHISDGTLSNDLDDIEKSMSHYNLSIFRKPGSGVSWEGKEEDYRQVMTMLLRKRRKDRPIEQLLEDSKVKELFGNNRQEILKKVSKIFQETQSVLDVQYTENSELHFIIYLMLTKYRLDRGYVISNEGKDLLSMMHLPETQAANWIGSKLSYMTDTPISEGEIYCIAMQLLSSKIWKNYNDSKYDEENFKIRQIVMRIMVNMEQLLGIDFLDNQTLIDGLSNHMRPAINRMKMNVFSENGNLDMIKENYGKIYQAVGKACVFLKEELKIDEIPEGELGFIAMYFCVAMEKRNNEEEKISVWVACPHGVGTSHMLSVHLQKEFPELRIQKIVSTAELDEKDIENAGIDLIISTSKLNLSFPNVCVNSVLLGPDKIMIRSKLSELKKTRKKIKQTNVEKTKNKKQISRADIEYMVILGREILQVLDNIKISPEVTFEDEKSLIACAGNLFARTEEDAQIITKDLIRREDISSTYIPGMNVLFLHSETRGVKHCRFGYIALKEPVTEKNREIKGAILMLIPKAHDIRIYREVMSEISGALAEKDHIINALYRKDRRSVELQLEESLGNYYEKRSNQK